MWSRCAILCVVLVAGCGGSGGGSAPIGEAGPPDAPGVDAVATVDAGEEASDDAGEPGDAGPADTGVDADLGDGCVPGDLGPPVLDPDAASTSAVACAVTCWPCATPGDTPWLCPGGNRIVLGTTLTYGDASAGSLSCVSDPTSDNVDAQTYVNCCHPR